MIKKKHLRKTAPENVRRLAKYLKLRDIDDMSDRQVIKLLAWYFSRSEKRHRGFIE